ncbi:hypothetical protein LX32DRAFT_681063 [Colletotrichum zoysiae]|uniref:Uncharacterized protein n=1 Tax=Colletotrichum zoysiae TaxID=1216348 RepID=A0AAD9HLZ4_9PEZI|nr:hypothetical protein LX32DRAFT_681063 [Colletotrichum zoysiae]
MQIPTFGQVATIGIAFIAATALAIPVAEPLGTDIVERSADLNTRGEGISAIATSVHALEQRTIRKCKRNKKGKCIDSDDDDDKKNKKKCKRNKKGKCIDSDSDDDKKNTKKCKRNKKGKCINPDDGKKNDDGAKNGDEAKSGDKADNGGHYPREVAVEFDLE